jgi:hypothetical protein
MGGDQDKSIKDVEDEIVRGKARAKELNKEIARAETKHLAPIDHAGRRDLSEQSDERDRREQCEGARSDDIHAFCGKTVMRVFDPPIIRVANIGGKVSHSACSISGQPPTI